MIKHQPGCGDNPSVGIADRDYMRRAAWPGGSSDPVARPGFIVALVAMAVLALLFAGPLNMLRGGTPGAGWAARIGAPVSLYPRNDQWTSYLPAPAACAESSNASAPKATAEVAMLCVLNYARGRAGLAPLPNSPLLDQSAELKASDIIRCAEFVHSACGKDPHAVADEVGYPQVSWGENLALSPGPFAAARVSADGWLNSEHHRENLLDPRWTEQGIAMIKVPEFQGQRDVAIWVSQFGERR